MTINGSSTNSCPPGTTETLSKREVDVGGEPNVNITYPPYAIHNGETLYYPVRFTTDFRFCLQAMALSLHVR